MKYGKHEYERNYLLDKHCLNGKIIKEAKEIKDKYISNTRLRLREVISNQKTQCKLTQKEKLTPNRQGVSKINTLYLSKLEFDKLYMLEGIEISKKRHIIEVDDVRIGIDLIKLTDKNLYIAEVEFESELKMNSFTMPLSHIREITGELNYNGYEIAKEYSKKNS